MNNYFGLGLDADLCLDFHNARQELNVSHSSSILVQFLYNSLKYNCMNTYSTYVYTL